ncbi:MAG TPA: hypothetical protein DCO77_12655, partial [Nitrospiraceae bacterium]|nr:hypothetical protein [Nitrospiraceae bacterium]
LFYFHGDHLGSSNMITDAKGAVYQHLEYFPFGESWIEEGGSYGGNTPGYKFTGKELDPETGLYYYGARYYDPTLGVWLSTDAALVSYLPYDPDRTEELRLMDEDQSTYRLKQENPLAYWKQILPGDGGVFNAGTLNLYGYAHQNPHAYVDPTGNAAIMQAWSDKFASSTGLAKFGLALLAPFAYVSHVAVNTVQLVAATIVQPFVWLDYSWAAPNTAAGLVAGFGAILLGGDVKPEWGKDARVVAPQWLGSFGAFSLGPVIVGDHNFGRWTHEYGHTWQSRILGPLYIPIIGVPSAISAGFQSPSKHKIFWTERWADAWSSWP